MATDLSPGGTRPTRSFSIVRAFHSFADVTEPVVEWLIRICGWSAILFVLAIFAFVFREAVPMLSEEGFSLTEMFRSGKMAARFRDQSAIRNSGAVGRNRRCHAGVDGSGGSFWARGRGLFV